MNMMLILCLSTSLAADAADTVQITVSFVNRKTSVELVGSWCATFIAEVVGSCGRHCLCFYYISETKMRLRDRVR